MKAGYFFSPTPFCHAFLIALFQEVGCTIYGAAFPNDTLLIICCGHWPSMGYMSLWVLCIRRQEVSFNSRLFLTLDLIEEGRLALLQKLCSWLQRDEVMHLFSRHSCLPGARLTCCLLAIVVVKCTVIQNSCSVQAFNIVCLTEINPAWVPLVIEAA